MDLDKVKELVDKAISEAVKEILAQEKAMCPDCGEEMKDDGSHSCDDDMDDMEMQVSDGRYLSTEDLEKYSKSFSQKKLDKFFKNSGNFLTCNLDLTIKDAAPNKDGVRTEDSYKPTKSQLKAINKTAKVDQTEDSGYVFKFQATNKKGAPDRSLQGISEYANNKLGMYALKNVIPFLVASKADCQDHTWKAINAFGYVIGYEVKEGALYYDVYVPKGEQTKEVLEMIFNGNLNKLSIGFGMSWLDVQCSSCKKGIATEECPHEPGELDEKGKLVTMTITDVLDNYEISGVAVPCQAEANITREKGLSPEGMKALTLDQAKIAKNLAESGSLFTVNQIRKLIDLPALEGPEGQEKVAIDKMDNGNHTIEDNKLEKPANQENTEVKTESVESTENVEAKAAAQPEVLTLSETKLCNVAKQIKSEVVEELKAVIESAPKADNSEVLEAIKSLKEDLVKELAEVKSFKAEVEAVKAEVLAAKEELNKNLAVSASVPVETVTNAAGMTSAKQVFNVSPDNLLGPLLG